MSNGKLAVVVALCTVCPLSAQSASPCDTEPRMATEFGSYTPLGYNLVASPGQLPQPFPIPEGNNIRSLRVLLTPIEDRSRDWTIVIRDADQRPLQSISSRQLSSDKPFWTQRFQTNSIQIFVESTAATPVARAVEYVATAKDAVHPYYSVLGPEAKWKDLFSDDSYFFRRRGDSIGMFIAHSSNPVSGTQLWTCSGFVIANKPDVLFVTNDHCGGPWDSADRWSASVCGNAVVDFSWDGKAVSREYTCEQVLRDEEDDLAILKLNSVLPEAPPPPLPLRAARLTSEEVAIIHHPAAMSKMISKGCSAAASDVFHTGTVDFGRDFVHRCDTEGGSSGAPVLDLQGRVVGVHHLGFERTASNSCDMLNKAVGVEKLIDLLHSQPSLTGYMVE
jgi:S1-C subfamily serine protease